jgi:hypothetical protein
VKLQRFRAYGAAAEMRRGEQKTTWEGRRVGDPYYSRTATSRFAPPGVAMQDRRRPSQKQCDEGGFSLTPGFSRVGGHGRKFNRYSGFFCARKTVETVFVHPAF